MGAVSSCCGNSPALLEAVEKGDLTTVKQCLQNPRVDLSVCNEDGIDLLVINLAGYETDESSIPARREILRLLLEANKRVPLKRRFPVDGRGTGLPTPLLRCAYIGDFESIIAFMDAGANVNASVPHQTTTLLSQWAMSRKGNDKDSPQLVEEYVKRGGNVNLCTDHLNLHPVLMATLMGKVELARALLKAGARVPKPTENAYGLDVLADAGILAKLREQYSQTNKAYFDDFRMYPARMQMLEPLRRQVKAVLDEHASRFSAGKSPAGAPPRAGEELDQAETEMLAAGMQAAGMRPRQPSESLSTSTSTSSSVQPPTTIADDEAVDMSSRMSDKPRGSASTVAGGRPSSVRGEDAALQMSEHVAEREGGAAAAAPTGGGRVRRGPEDMLSTPAISSAKQSLDTTGKAIPRSSDAAERSASTTSTAPSVTPPLRTHSPRHEHEQDRGALVERDTPEQSLVNLPSSSSMEHVDSSVKPDFGASVLSSTAADTGRGSSSKAREKAGNEGAGRIASSGEAAGSSDVAGGSPIRGAGHVASTDNKKETRRGSSTSKIETSPLLESRREGGVGKDNNDKTAMSTTSSESDSSRPSASSSLPLLQKRRPQDEPLLPENPEVPSPS